MLPAVVVAIAALSAGAAAGRQYLKGRVKEQKSNAIEVATKLVCARIAEGADHYIGTSLKTYATNIALKLSILGAIWSAAQMGWVQPQIIGWTLMGVFALFLIYDTIRIWPTARLAVSELRRNGWRPRQTLAEIVAAQVFDQVLTEAKARKTDWWSDLAVRLTGSDATLVSQEIALAVADVARKTSWDQLKPFLISGALKFAGLLTVYSILATGVVLAMAA
jgi:hypothetical protein